MAVYFLLVLMYISQSGETQFILNELTTKYQLPSYDSGTCTIHLKLFSNNARSLEIYNNIIMANLHKAIWTTWGFNVSEPLVRMLTPFSYPQISFHEQCSINLLIEDPTINKRGHTSLSRYAILTGYASVTSGINSIFIQVKLNCLADVGHYNYFAPHTLFLFLYFVNQCVSVNNLKFKGSNNNNTFPGFLFDPHSPPHLIGLELLNQSMYDTKNIRKTLKLLKQNATKPMFVASGAFKYNNWEDLDCSQLRTNPISLKAGFYCSNNLLVLNELGKKLRLTFRPFNSIRKTGIFGSGTIPDSTLYSGTMVPMVRFQVTKKSEQMKDSKHPRVFLMSRLSLVSAVNDVLLYCTSSVIRGQQISFAAWWSPFQWNVWLLALVAFIATSITLAVQINKKSTINLNTFLFSTFAAFCSVVRQDRSLRSRLLILFSYTALVCTNLYENTITSDLILPNKPHIVKDLDELLRLNYKIFVTILSENEMEEAAYRNLCPFKRKILKNGALIELNPTKTVLRHDWYIGKDGMVKLAVYAAGNKDDLSLQIHALQTMLNVPCGLVEEPMEYVHRYWEILSYVQNEAFQLIERYRETGLLHIWRKTQIWLESVIRRRLEKEAGLQEERQETNLSFWNLIPVLSVLGPGFFISGAVFVIECNVLRIRLLKFRLRAAVQLIRFHGYLCTSKWKTTYNTLTNKIVVGYWTSVYYILGKL
jgi:hypothetical protein